MRFTALVLVSLLALSASASLQQKGGEQEARPSNVVVKAETIKWECSLLLPSEN
jgi:hypothetical protein